MSEFKNKVVLSHDCNKLFAHRIGEDGLLQEGIEIPPAGGVWDSGNMRVFFDHCRQAVDPGPPAVEDPRMTEVGGKARPDPVVEPVAPVAPVERVPVRSGKSKKDKKRDKR